MSRKQKFRPAPRMLNCEQLADYLNKSVSWIIEHRAKLMAAGFPKPDPILGDTDQDAVDAWLDRRSELLSNAGDDDFSTAISGIAANRAARKRPAAA